MNGHRCSSTASTGYLFAIGQVTEIVRGRFPFDGEIATGVFKVLIVRFQWATQTEAREEIVVDESNFSAREDLPVTYFRVNG
jgi:hypothetical protein